MHPVDVVDRLATFPLFADVPRDQLEWLVARGEVRACAADTIVLDVGTAIDELLVVVAGSGSLYSNKSGVWRRAAESGPGRVHGAIPYSRGRTSIRRLAVEESATLFALHRSHFTELIRECPQLTAALVHEMIDRARLGRTEELHDERLRSLGRLASGLAHELHNPASAASRSAASLTELLDEAEGAARNLTRSQLNPVQLDALEAVKEACSAPEPLRSALELMDREDEFAGWFERHGIAFSGADALASSDVRVSDLDGLAAALPAPALDAAVRWAASGRNVRAAAQQIAAATGRIHDLVDAVKRFTFMDRESLPGEIDVAQGLADTLAMLQHKSSAKAVDVRLEVASDIPRVYGFGSEINQVWEKLVDNAIDAAGRGGHVTVMVTSRGDAVVVQVTDDGPGIPEEHRERVFDPFFTTKPVGHGSGLGLDLARRAVLFHHGDLAFTSEPGRTVFRVQLPVTGARTRANSSASSP